MVTEATSLTVPGPQGDREVRISSPSRVLWPEMGPDRFRSFLEEEWPRIATLVARSGAKPG